MNKKAILPVLLNPKLIGAVFRFIIGVLLFKWSHPQLVALGVPSELTTVILVCVLGGLGIWTYIRFPF